MKKTARMALVAGLACLALTACGDRDDSSDGAADPTPSETASSEATEAAEQFPDFKACMVSDSGGFDDKSFNQTSHDGLMTPPRSLGVQTGEVESQSDTEYADNIQAHGRPRAATRSPPSASCSVTPPRPRRRRTPTSTSRSSTIAYEKPPATSRA